MIKIAPIQSARGRRPTSPPLRARSTPIGARAKHVPKPAYRESQAHPPHGAPVPRDGAQRICEKWRRCSNAAVIYDTAQRVPGLVAAAEGLSRGWRTGRSTPLARADGVGAPHGPPEGAFC